jgi:hypothetical protein
MLTKLTLAAILAFGATSAALANDIETNPSTAQSTREWAAFMGQKQTHTSNAGSAYGLASQNDQGSGKRSHGR